MDSRVLLTAGENAIFLSLRRLPALRIEEVVVGREWLRYYLTDGKGVKDYLKFSFLRNGDIFGLMALGLLEEEKAGIWTLSKLSKTLVEIDSEV